MGSAGFLGIRDEIAERIFSSILPFGKIVHAGIHIFLLGVEKYSICHENNRIDSIVAVCFFLDDELVRERP